MNSDEKNTFHKKTNDVSYYNKNVTFNQTCIEEKSVTAFI